MTLLTYAVCSKQTSMSDHQASDRQCTTGAYGNKKTLLYQYNGKKKHKEIIRSCANCMLALSCSLHGFGSCFMLLLLWEGQRREWRDGSAVPHQLFFQMALTRSCSACHGSAATQGLSWSTGSSLHLPSHSRCTRLHLAVQP